MITGESESGIEFRSGGIHSQRARIFTKNCDVRDRSVAGGVKHGDRISARSADETFAARKYDVSRFILHIDRVGKDAARHRHDADAVRDLIDPPSLVVI